MLKKKKTDNKFWAKNLPLPRRDSEPKSQNTQFESHSLTPTKSQSLKPQNSQKQKNKKKNQVMVGEWGVDASAKVGIIPDYALAKIDLRVITVAKLAKSYEKRVKDLWVFLFI